MIKMKPIGETIRQLRKDAGLSQVDLGKRLGWGQGRLSAYERKGKMTEIYLSTAAAIAEACGVTVSAFFDGAAAGATGRAAKQPNGTRPAASNPGKAVPAV
jgi:transcriptional regulator with XRE-family HTH domain